MKNLKRLDYFDNVCKQGHQLSQYWGILNVYCENPDSIHLYPLVYNKVVIL